MPAEIISLKKLKKDGSIDSSVTQKMIGYLKKGESVLLPIDSIYGIACTTGLKCVDQPDPSRVKRTVLIASFSMLESIASIDKLEFDFLHRIWPGEMVVYLRSKDSNGKIPFRMPRHKYESDIINGVGQPLGFVELCDEKGKPVFRKKSLLSLDNGAAACRLIVDEACKEHSLPSVIDITGGSVEVLYEGRVSTDEIKSLYFLGADDSDI